MCGFFGISLSEGISVSDNDLGNFRLSLRGPDSFNSYHSDDLRNHAIHYRLAINDLSKAGTQPFSTKDFPQKLLIFNGEIYNFRELRHILNGSIPLYSLSDTEVLYRGLCEFGIQFLEKISGPFSLCFIDRTYNSLVLARDRFGEKPLFYRHDPSMFIYGSDALQVASFHKENVLLNNSAVSSFFTKGHPPQCQTLFDGVSEVKPGQTLTLSLQPFTLSFNYCNSFAYTKPSPLSLSGKKRSCLLESTERLISLLRVAVNRQLSSDRSSSLLLSGGVDSSIICALASDYTSKLCTYTVKFPDIDSGKESYIARNIADYFGTKHQEISISSFSTSDFDELMAKLDQPLADPSLLPSFIIYKRISQSHTVVLTGDGADELFGGYLHYQRIQLISRYQYILKHIPFQNSFISNFFTYVFPGSSKWLKAVTHDFTSHPFTVREIFSQRTLLRLFTSEYMVSSDTKGYSCTQTIKSPIRAAMNYDIDNYLASIVLPKTDRSSMINGVEVRCPFLGLEVSNFSLSLSDSLLVSLRTRKIILNQIADRLLPARIRSLQSKKYGFSFCINSFFRIPKWTKYLQDSVYESGIPINYRYFRAMIDEHHSGVNHGHEFYVLLVICRWSLIHNVPFV